MQMQNKAAPVVFVVNYSGNTGKTSVARHLLAPRLGAEMVSIETINAGGVEGSTFSAKQFVALTEKLLIRDPSKSVVVDIGSSNIDAVMNHLRNIHDAQADIDLFVVPTVPENKQKIDTISMVRSLAQIGVPKQKICVILNQVEIETIDEKFADLYEEATRVDVKDTLVATAFKKLSTILPESIVESGATEHMHVEYDEGAESIAQRINTRKVRGYKELRDAVKMSLERWLSVDAQTDQGQLHELVKSALALEETKKIDADYKAASKEDRPKIVKKYRVDAKEQLKEAFDIEKAVKESLGAAIAAAETDRYDAAIAEFATNDLPGIVASWCAEREATFKLPRAAITDLRFRILRTPILKNEVFERLNNKAITVPQAAQDKTDYRHLIRQAASMSEKERYGAMLVTVGMAKTMNANLDAVFEEIGLN